MIRAHDLRQYISILYLISQPVGHDKVVDTPADVALSCCRAVAPPGIRIALIGVKRAEAVDKSGIEKLCKLAAFFVGKAGVKVVSVGIFEVYLAVDAVDTSGRAARCRRRAR